MWLERERKGRRREGEGGREGRCEIGAAYLDVTQPYRGAQARLVSRLGRVRLFRIKQSVPSPSLHTEPGPAQGCVR